MGKYKTREAARKAALEANLLYGWSVLSGAYYTGTDVQLADIGVILRLRPDDESIRQDADFCAPFGGRLGGGRSERLVNGGWG